MACPRSLLTIDNLEEVEMGTRLRSSQTGDRRRNYPDKDGLDKQHMQPLRMRLCFPPSNQPTTQPQMEIRHPKQAMSPPTIDRRAARWRRRSCGSDYSLSVLYTCPVMALFQNSREIGRFFSVDAPCFLEYVSCRSLFRLPLFHVCCLSLCLLC